jgi:hypothetical protein
MPPVGFWFLEQDKSSMQHPTTMTKSRREVLKRKLWVIGGVSYMRSRGLGAGV